MDNKAAYTSRNWNSQIHAMDANHYALEGSRSNYAIWNYASLNDHQWGDQWNGEDLSIYSKDDVVGPSSSAARSRDSIDASSIDKSNLQRALSRDSMSSDRTTLSTSPLVATRASEAFIRPSPVYTAGVIESSGFDLAKATFKMTVKAEKPAEEEWPTEIFIPEIHFPDAEGAVEVKVEGGRWELDRERSVLRWWNEEGVRKIEVKGREVGTWGLVGEEGGVTGVGLAAGVADFYGKWQCAIM